MTTYDAAAVKQAAAGRWHDICVSQGIGPEYLTGKHGPCPKCGGKDRQRVYPNFADTGGMVCNQCGQNLGDGFATLMWWLDLDFPSVVQRVADHLGLGQEPDDQTMDFDSVIGGRARVNGKPRVVAEYDYRDESGELLFQVCRYEPKDFRQRRPDGRGGYTWKTKGVRQVPYRLPQLLAQPRKFVFAPEGERDVHSLESLGLLATCNAGGAGKWTAEHSQCLRGRKVFVLPDNDAAGLAHAEQVAASLHGIAESVRIVELPGLCKKGDLSDWLAAGGTREQLIELASAAPVWAPSDSPPTMEPWPEIIPFDTPDPPSFPSHVLPGVLRNWVEAESIATQTPLDLAGLLSLACCSATLARRVEIQPRPGWREPVNLFTAELLEPGNRKSAVFSDALKPLRELEAEMTEDARPAVARAKSVRRQNEARLKRLEKIAAEKSGGDAARARDEAAILAADLAEQPEPVLPRLLVDDATAEKLGMMLAEQGGRIASMSPEGGVFDLMGGMYSKSGIPSFNVYLMGHAGDDLVTDRVSRESVFVPRPALTCCYAMQPAVITGLADKPSFRGRGLLARFLYAAPQSWIGRREIAAKPVPGSVVADYHRTVRSLEENFGNCGTTSEPFVLGLTPDAGKLLLEWETEIESMLDDGGAMESIRDWGSKLAGATLRIAAVLHCVEHGKLPLVDDEILGAAIEIGRYLIPHAELVLNAMTAGEGSTDEDARYLLRWIKRHRHVMFSKREAYRHGRSRFPRPEDIDPAMEELTRRGYVRPKLVEASGPGRPPSPGYETNPATFERKRARKR